MIVDAEAEKKWNFSLHACLKRAEKYPLLDGYKVFATSKTLPTPNEIKEIVISAGGTYLSKLPVKPEGKCFVVTCKEDEGSCGRAKQAGVQCVDKEIILTGLLRQKIVVQDHIIF